MSVFAGKKALCFIALPHHNRILLPVMEALQERGMEVRYFTAPAEAAFEITLNQAGLSYFHALDFITPEVRQKAEAAFATLRPLWQERVLDHPVLQAVPLPIQDKVIRAAVENVFCFQQMLEVEKPDLLFALHELNSWGKILGYLSHLYRIPYITFQEGLCYGSTPLYRFHTDYSAACVVWGEADRKVLLAAGCGADKIFALGNIDLWAAKKEATSPETRAATLRALDIGAEKKVVLFLMSHALYKPFDAASFLAWLQARGDVVAIFKWHPITNRTIIDRALSSLSASPLIRSLQGFDAYALLGVSHVCVLVGNSTTGLEALAFGKPLIEISLPDQPYSFSAQGVAEPARGFADLGEKIELLLAQGPSPERQKQVEHYLARHFAAQDDGAVLRVVAMVEEMLRARERPLGVDGAPKPKVPSRFPCSLILPVDEGPLEPLLSTLKGIAAHVPPELFEVLLVDGWGRPEVRELWRLLGGDVRLLTLEAGEEKSFALCCNQAAQEAQGAFLVFLKPGLIPCPGWLEGLLRVGKEEKDVGVVGGRVVHENGLLWHMGVAFDINQSPFPLYRFLPPEFSGARRQREFRAVEVPFLVPRELFERLGGFSPDLLNRFEDIDFCLRVRRAGLRVLYTPRGNLLRVASSWEPTPRQDELSRMRFYARWTGFLWQDDEFYLQEDSLSHESLSAFYRELAARVATGSRKALARLPATLH